MKKITVLSLSSLLLSNLIHTTVLAQEHDSNNPQENTLPAYSMTNTQSQPEYFLSDSPINVNAHNLLNKIATIANYFYFEDETLQVSLTKEQLINDYGFSEHQYADLQNIMQNAPNLTPKKIFPGSTRAHVENGTLYISNYDISSGAFVALSTAAAAGPAALSAAITTISTAVSGPVGTIVSTISTIIAGPSLTELAGRITHALATGQGIYIKPVASYPPLDIGYW